MIDLPRALTLLLAAFIVMKVAGIIDWSWWLVLSPIYPAIIFMLIWIGIVTGVWRNITRRGRL